MPEIKNIERDILASLSKLRINVLAIGINKYENHKQLRTAVNGAIQFCKTLKSKYGVNSSDIRLLLNWRATGANIDRQLRKYQKELNDNDILIIYFAGHGQFDHKHTGSSYLIPVEGPDGKNTVHGLISHESVKTYLNSMNTRHVFLIVDACYSGGILRLVDDDEEPVDGSVFLSEIDETSRLALTSGQMHAVFDDGYGGHSVFTHYLLKALENNKDQYITPYQIFKNVRDIVYAETNKKQRPDFGPIRSKEVDNGNFGLLRTDFFQAEQNKNTTPIFTTNEETVANESKKNLAEDSAAAPAANTSIYLSKQNIWFGIITALIIGAAALIYSIQKAEYPISTANTLSEWSLKLGRTNGEHVYSVTQFNEDYYVGGSLKSQSCFTEGCIYIAKVNGNGQIQQEHTINSELPEGAKSSFITSLETQDELLYGSQLIVGKNPQYSSRFFTVSPEGKFNFGNLITSKGKGAPIISKILSDQQGGLFAYSGSINNLPAIDITNGRFFVSENDHRFQEIYLDGFRQEKIRNYVGGAGRIKNSVFVLFENNTITKNAEITNYRSNGIFLSRWDLTLDSNWIQRKQIKLSSKRFFEGNQFFISSDGFIYIVSLRGSQKLAIQKFSPNLENEWITEISVNAGLNTFEFDETDETISILVSGYGEIDKYEIIDILKHSGAVKSQILKNQKSFEINGFERSGKNSAIIAGSLGTGDRSRAILIRREIDP